MNPIRRLGHRSSASARALLPAIVLAVSVADAVAQPAYPSRPIQLVVGLAAGGPTDAVARTVAQLLGEQLGQPEPDAEPRQPARDVP